MLSLIDRVGPKTRKVGAGWMAFANFLQISNVWLYNARMNLSIIFAGILVCFGFMLLAIYFLSEAHMVVVLALGVMSMMMGAFLCADVFTRRN
jgi:hypothetical protein